MVSLGSCEASSIGGGVNGGHRGSPLHRSVRVGASPTLGGIARGGRGVRPTRDFSICALASTTLDGERTERTEGALRSGLPTARQRIFGNSSSNKSQRCSALRRTLQSTRSVRSATSLPIAVQESSRREELRVRRTLRPPRPIRPLQFRAMGGASARLLGLGA